MNYNEEYRRLFTLPNCLMRYEHDHINLHLYSIPLDEDEHLNDKLDFMMNKEDFVLSKLLRSLKDDLSLDLNALSTSNLERQNNHFVVNSLILNVENYLERFDEIQNLRTTISPVEMNIRECAYKALDEKYK